MRRIASAAVLVVVLLAGCVPAPAEERDAAAEPDPVLLGVGDLLDEDGALPLEAAQRIFAATVGELPGVEPLTIGDEVPGEFAGAAIRRLQGAVGELPPAVAEAVDAALEPPADEPEIEIATAALRPFGAAEPEVPSREELAEAISGLVTELEVYSGHDLRVPIRARIASGLRSDGVASAILDGAGRVTGCRIALAPEAFAAEPESARSTIAHEVWHCFQLDANRRAHETGPLWIIEGQAEWVGETIVGGSPSSAANWDTWLMTPHRALTTRSYDAIGTYAVADASRDVWEALIPMLGMSTPAALERLHGVAPVDAVGATATAITRAPEFGIEWESTGPGITDSRAELVLDVPEGPAVNWRAELGRYGTLPVRISATVDEVLRVEIDGDVGAVAMPGAGTVELSAGGVAFFCLGGECTCPDASSGAGREIPRADSGMGVAAVGRLDAGPGGIIAEGLSLAEACDRPGLVGVWQTDVSHVMAALAAAYGTQPSCTGPWVATFGADGSWSAGYEASCTFGEAESQATARFTGRYVDAGTSFAVSDVAGEGTMTIGDLTMPLPGVDGWYSMLGGEVDYVIAGDVLTYVVVTPEGVRVPISLTRVG